MKRVVFLLPALLCGCSLMKEIADAGKEQFGETGGAIVDAVEKAAGGDPTAIIAASVAAVGFIGAVIGRIIIKRRKAAA